MKGLLTSVLGLFVSWIATLGAVLYGLRAVTGRPLVDGIGAALLVGSLSWIAVACLRVVARSLRERATIRRGMDGEPPADGATVLIGRIDAPRPLTAPFDGRECVAYSYEIWRMVGSGRQRTRFVPFRGLALAPSQIVTGGGTFRLLAVPTIEGATACDAPDAAARSRIANFLRDTPFTPRSSGRTATHALEAQWSDADGDYRRDVSSLDGQPSPVVDFDEWRFDQQVVPRGAEVCVFGHYSAAQRAIVPHADWSRTTRLLIGDPLEARKKLFARARLQFIFFTVLALASAGLFQAFVSGTG